MMFDSDALEGARGEAARASKPSTPAQRFAARRLMHALHLPVDEIALAHRRFFVFANVTFPTLGKRMDDVLDALSADALTALNTEFERAREECTA